MARLLDTDAQFDPAHRYSHGNPIDLVGNSANEPFTHGAGAAGGAIEPFPFTNPSSPQNMSQGLSHEGYAGGPVGPGSSSAHGPEGGYNPRMSYGDYGQMAMPDARNYAPGGGAGAAGPGGWSGYGGDGYATAAGIGAGGAAAAAAGAAGIGAFNNRHQQQQQQGYSGYDYRSESTSQSGDSAYPPSNSANGNNGFGGSGLGMTALTPAAIAKQREATGGAFAAGRQGQGHAQQPSWGSYPAGTGAGPSGSPYNQAAQGGPSSPTSDMQDPRRQSGPYSDDQHYPQQQQQQAGDTSSNRQSGVFVHRDMDDVPEHALGDELPPQYV